MNVLDAYPLPDVSNHSSTEETRYVYYFFISVMLLFDSS